MQKKHLRLILGTAPPEPKSLAVLNSDWPLLREGGRKVTYLKEENVCSPNFQKQSTALVVVPTEKKQSQ